MGGVVVDPAVTEGPNAEAVERRLRAVLDGVASFTIGAEEELILVDAETLAPSPAAAEALLTFAGDRRLTGELLQCQVEAVTPVSVSVADLVRELTAVRRLLVARLDAVALPVATGAHPWARDVGPLAAAPRYRLIADAHPLAARRMLACGLHVHVAVGGADRALAVHNALRSYLPLVAALAANAPFHEGEDTTMASVRPTLLRHLSRTGTPPAFASLADYADLLVWARSAGAHDASHHWWDLRIHPANGTLEVRVADVPTRVEDTGAIAALVQSLVFWLAGRHDEGETLAVHPTERIEANARLAARHGVHASLADLDGGAPIPVRELAFALVDAVLPAARDLGCEEELLGVYRIVRDGGGATRQRRVAEAAGIEQLVRWLAAETAGLRWSTVRPEEELLVGMP